MCHRTLLIPACTCACACEQVRMKQDGPAMLADLEAWCEKQAHGMELARNLDTLTKSFDNLLKVMDALYQVRVLRGKWRVVCRGCGIFQRG